jgi:hypothetical protein
LDNIISMRFLFCSPLFLVSYLSLGQQPTYQKIWETSAAFINPYAVIHDNVNDVFYVSNMNLTPMDSEYDWGKRNDGFISKVSAKGETIALKWIDGLIDPAGMFIRDNLLYVADDEFLVIVDIANGKIIKRASALKLVKEQPASQEVYQEGAETTGKPAPPPAHLRKNMLNSVTGSADGSIFIRDTGYNSIYKWRDNKLTVMFEDERLSGNTDIIWNDQKKLIWVVNYGSIIAIPPDDKYKSSNTLDLNAAHSVIGIARMKDFYILVSSFDEVYKYQYGELTELFKAAEPCQCRTDIEVANEEIVVLDSKLNKLMSFKIQ